MKISRSLIRKIIKEEIETLSYDAKTISAEEQESALLAKDKAEDIEAVEDAWSGGSNLVHPVDYEDLSVDDKVQHGQEILAIGVVESILNDFLSKVISEQSSSPDRAVEIQDAIFSAIESQPGIAGLDLVQAVKTDVTDAGRGIPLTEAEVFEALDSMLEDDLVFFDDEEDAWFVSLEDLQAHRKEGGVWSDDKDYEAGFYR